MVGMSINPRRGEGPKFSSSNKHALQKGATGANRYHRTWEDDDVSLGAVTTIDELMSTEELAAAAAAAELAEAAANWSVDDGVPHPSGDYAEVRITPSGGKEYLDDEGNAHRIDGPAIVRAHGSDEYRVNGLLHSIDDRPATTAGARKTWFDHGVKHRGDGKPAVEFDNGAKEWWEDGEFVRREEAPPLTMSQLRDRQSRGYEPMRMPTRQRYGDESNEQIMLRRSDEIAQRAEAERMAEAQKQVTASRVPGMREDLGQNLQWIENRMEKNLHPKDVLTPNAMREVAKWGEFIGDRPYQAIIDNHGVTVQFEVAGQPTDVKMDFDGYTTGVGMMNDDGHGMYMDSRKAWAASEAGKAVASNAKYMKTTYQP